MSVEVSGLGCGYSKWTQLCHAVGGASLERAQGVTSGADDSGEGQGTSLTLYQGGSPEEAVSGESLGGQEAI